jgi:hypothetical protein
VSTVVVGSFPLGEINVALDGTVSLIPPVLSQVDLMLTGQFGLGALVSDLSAQLNAALSLQATLTLQLVNPFASLAAQLAAILQIQAGIAATLALGLPAVSTTVAASISGSAGISAALGVKVAGLQALIKTALSAKLPLASVLETFNLSAGPVELLSIGYASPSTLASSGAEYEALTLGPLGSILPGDRVWGVVLLTNDSSVAAALSAIIRTS